MWQDILETPGFEYKDTSDFPEDAFGFIYKIVNNTNQKYYIGKKYLWFTNKKKIGKKQRLLNKKKGIRNLVERVKKESDWKEYWGSEPILLGDIKKLGKDKFKRKILKICYSKKELTYYEMFFQIEERVLHNDKSYNQSILGKFFKKDVKN